MSRIRSVVSDGDLRVILCLRFDHRAPSDEVGAFKRCIIECPNVVQSMECTGPFDFMVEATLQDMAEYNEKLAGVTKPLGRLVARYEACFVCKRHIRTDEPEDSLWVQCPDGTRRIDCSLIDRITAEGDYMRVHCADQSWLVHATLKSIIDKLDPDIFVHVHRSVILRSDFIESVVHRGKRWSARLRDGSQQQIAKSHVGAVLEVLRIAPPKPEAVSSNLTAVNDKLISVAE